MNEHPTPTHPGIDLKRVLGLTAGPLLALALLLLEPPGRMPGPAWQVLAVTLWMAVWWLTEAIPISATALLPLILFPLLGVADIETAAAAYANPVVFLFLGGFLLALGMQQWQLHRRIALAILQLTGQRADAVVGGFMLASAFLSMWVSNTATAAMMLPIGLSVIQLIGQSPLTDARSLHRLSLALLLGIAFGANIGGMATLIGTPPNALLAGFLREAHGLDVGFLQWLLVGLPAAATLLPLAWLLLTRWLYPLSGQRVLGVADLLAEQRGWLGRLEGGERRVALICVATALAWMTRPWLDSLLPGMRLTDAGIAISAGVLLFCMPGTGGRMLLDWEATRELPWGVLLLVGGGLSLGGAVEASGLSAWIAQSLGLLAAWPLWLLIVALALCVMLASHITSNTATAATFIPLAAGLALGLGEAPILLTVPVALAASCAFMLPVATPPNAIVFASGRLRVADMARAGAWLSVLALAVVTLAALVLAPRVFG